MSNEHETPVEAIPVDQPVTSRDEAHVATQEQPAHETEDKKPRRRSRRKSAEETTAEATQEAVQEQAHADLAEGEIPTTRVWQPHFAAWEDVAAGVKLVEDRRDGNQVIHLRERPSAQSLELLAAAGWVRDAEMGEIAFTKPVSDLHPPAQREETESLVKDLANAARTELGLEEKKSYYISRG